MRKLERSYRKNSAVTSRDEWILAQKEYMRVINAKRSEYWIEKIDSERTNPRRLWNTVKTVISEVTVPTEIDISPEAFSKFFREKIESIRAFTSHAPPPIFTDSSKEKLSSFKPTTLEEVKRIISGSPNKQCSLDPIPTWLLKKCSTVLAPFLVHVFNKSLSTGEFPGPLKSAVVTPI